MMPVEISQWRATIGCFHVSVQKSSPLMKSVKPFSVVFQILKLFWFFYCFIAISILALPVTLTIQFLAVHSVTTQSRFLPLFARVHHFAKSVLYATIVSHELLNPNQSGFRPGDSTVNQLLSITHTIFKAFDCNPPLDVRTVYLDISKAFDRVWHDGLIYKLKRCGVSGQLLLLIQSFLKDRKQRTVLNGQSSTWGDISAGVPQGSILGPLFFLVYINDLAVGLKCNVKLFADDTSLFTVVEDSNTAANDMNHDLNSISQWAHAWRMSFNPDPQKQAVELTFSRKKIEIDHPVIHFNDIPVKKVDEHKHLGITLDSKLSFFSSHKISYFKN